jgi:hypothetical protein
MNSLISGFVHDALQRGISREDIVRALQAGAWDSKEINAALDAYVESDLPVPVPKKRVSSSPKEAFLFLMLFAALYTAAFALGSALFDLINLGLPQPDEMVRRSIVSLRYGLASVIVAFPIFLLMSRVVSRETVRNPGQRISPVRRWLTYMTLFVASISIVTDLIVLIIRLLEGDITLRFILKIAVVAVLAGGTFAYYLCDLRRDEVEPSPTFGATPKAKMGIAALICAVSAVVFAAFWSVGSPVQARMLEQDALRVQDLTAIYQSVSQFYSSKGNLPESLEVCNSNPGTFIAQKTDRITGKPYEYQVLDSNRFQLKATFATRSEIGRATGVYLSPAQEGFWRHEAGDQSFIVDVTKENIAPVFRLQP